MELLDVIAASDTRSAITDFWREEKKMIFALYLVILVGDAVSIHKFILGSESPRSRGTVLSKPCAANYESHEQMLIVIYLTSIEQGSAYG